MVRLPLRHRPAAHLFRAFDVGGLSDAVQDGRTGRLIPFGKTELMAASILESLAEGSLAMLGHAVPNGLVTPLQRKKWPKNICCFIAERLGWSRDANVIPIFLFQPLNDISETT